MSDAREAGWYFASGWPGPVYFDGECIIFDNGCRVQIDARNLLGPLVAQATVDRAVFDAGFAACRAYGDNHAHYCGEQADKVFAAAMKRLAPPPSGG